MTDPAPDAWAAVGAALARRTEAAVLGARILGLEQYVAAADLEVADTWALLEAEQADVTALRRPWARVRQVLGDGYAEDLAAERAEQDAARLALTSLQNRRDQLFRQLDEAHAALAALGDVDAALDEAVDGYLRSTRRENVPGLRAATKRLTALRVHATQVEEAWNVGAAALGALGDADEMLQAAQSSGPGLGLLAALDTRNDLEDAADLLAEAASWLERFRAAATDLVDAAVPEAFTLVGMPLTQVWLDSLAGTRLIRRTDAALEVVTAASSALDEAMTALEARRDELTRLIADVNAERYALLATPLAPPIRRGDPAGPADKSRGPGPAEQTRSRGADQVR